MTKKEKVWKYLLKKPLATSKEVAKAVGCTTHYVASLKKKVGTPKEVFEREQELTERVALLNAAASLTSGDRQKDYGNPVDNMYHIAQIFNAITGHNIKTSEVPMFHIATKLARMQTSPTKRDHYIDIMAYAGITYECEKE
jgi:hypothetical protein